MPGGYEGLFWRRGQAMPFMAENVDDSSFVIRYP